MKSIRQYWCVALVALLVGGCTSGTAPESVPEPAPQAKLPLEELAGPFRRVVAGREFVGPEACRECHQERVEEFLLTNHARTCRVPMSAEMPSAFSDLAANRNKFQGHYPEVRFEMSRQGDRFFQTAIHKTGTGEERVTSSIDLILGAGTADDVYLSWHADDTIWELPIAWIWTGNEWGSQFFDRYKGGDFARYTFPRCLECHNTWLEFAPGSVNRFHRDHMVLGVTCERCHGPAAEHVAFHQAHPGEQTGQKNLQPATLARDRLIDVCTQCHGNSITHRAATFSYRPGQPLEEFYRCLEDHWNEDDHVANQISYLRQSKCFQNSEMTCITCHDPHVPASRAPDPSLACSQCHQPQDCLELPRLPEAIHGACANCHMPQYAKMNVIFETQTDNHLPPLVRHEHRIAVHSAAPDEVLLTWLRTQPDEEHQQQAAELTTRLIEYWLARAQEFEDRKRFLAAIGAAREAARIDPTPQVQQRVRELSDIQTQIDDLLMAGIANMGQARNEDARKDFDQLLKIQPDNADAAGRLGTLAAMAGNDQQAKSHWESVLQNDPNDMYGVNMLGWTSYLKNDFEAAVDYYEQARVIEPANAKLEYQYGLALLKLGQSEAAERAFLHALQVDPAHQLTLQLLGPHLVRQNKGQEAIELAQRAVAATAGKDFRVILFLADLQASTRDFSGAAKTLEALLSFPEMVPDSELFSIRQKLSACQRQSRP